MIGHRGCAGSRPENTLLAFATAIEIGAQIVETDLHGSADGVPVLCHDATVDRTTNGSGAIAELSFDALRRLDAGFGFRDDEGETPFRGTGLTLPRLEEALGDFPTLRFNIEIKQENRLLCQRVLEIIDDFDAADRILLTAGEPSVMEILRGCLERHPCRVAQGASTADVVGFLGAALGSGSPPPHPMVLQIPAEFQGAPLVTREFVEFAHRQGVEVHVWTINETPEMSRLLTLGVDGLVTDFPSRLKDLLDDNSEITRP